MLTTNEHMNLDIGDNYFIKNSPDTSSDNSSSNDYMDIQSDVDFLQQLSSDLDIPLLLNDGEDEMNLLNSFYDKSPQEILSDISPTNNFSKLFSDFIKEENLPSVNVKNEHTVHIKNTINATDLKIEPPKIHLPIKSHSPPIISPSNNIILQKNSTKALNNCTKISGQKITFGQNSPTVPTVINNQIVVLKQENPTTRQQLINPISPIQVPVKTITVFPNTNLLSNTRSTIVVPSLQSKNYSQIDQKYLKKVQRKIKNRESACLSRKKKKDYLTALENSVKELTSENEKLKAENCELKLRLSHYEQRCKPEIGMANLNVKGKIAVCMFFLILGVNLDVLRLPMGNNTNNILSPDLKQVSHYGGRNLLWINENENSSYKSNITDFFTNSMCPLAINKTESARLVLELERWIGKAPNETTPPNIYPNIANGIKIPKLKNWQRKKYNLDSSLIPSVYSMEKKIPRHRGIQRNELEVFHPSLEQTYADFFEAINRKKDTFYVVSFSEQHMLLPALHHNSTSRPKMSLIMPSLIQNNVTHPRMVSLMQIDCEVLDTKMINVKWGTIPEQFRKGSNSTNSDKYTENQRSGNNKRKYKKDKQIGRAHV